MRMHQIMIKLFSNQCRGVRVNEEDYETFAPLTYIADFPAVFFHICMEHIIWSANADFKGWVL